MNLKRLALLVAAMAMLPAAGCGKLAEKATEKATEKIAEQACKDGVDGEDCQVDFSEDGVKVNTDDGSFEIGENTDYPDAYPDYLKLDGFSPMQAMQLDDNAGLMVTLVNPNASGDGAEALASLTGQAEGAGCTVDEEMADIATQMEMNSTTLNCSYGSVTLSSLGAPDESGQMIQVMVGNDE